MGNRTQEITAQVVSTVWMVTPGTGGPEKGQGILVTLKWASGVSQMEKSGHSRQGLAWPGALRISHGAEEVTRMMTKTKDTTHSW